MQCAYRTALIPLLLFKRVSILNTRWQWAVHMLIYWTCWNVINDENYYSRHIFGHVAQSTLIYGIFPVHLLHCRQLTFIECVYVLLLLHFSRAYNPHNKQLSFVYANIKNIYRCREHFFEWFNGPHDLFMTAVFFMLPFLLLLQHRKYVLAFFFNLMNRLSVITCVVFWSIQTAQNTKLNE